MTDLKKKKTYLKLTFALTLLLNANGGKREFGSELLVWVSHV